MKMEAKMIQLEIFPFFRFDSHYNKQLWTEFFIYVQLNVLGKLLTPISNLLIKEKERQT